MKHMTIKNKIALLFTSVRFWQLTFATIFVILGHYFPGLEFMWNALATYLAAVTAVGTIDKASAK